MRRCVVLAAWAGLALPEAALALGNPASVFCETMGGQSVIAKLSDGSAIGLCTLPGKKIVEEWTLFRMFQGVKPAPNDNPFR
ncbi:DUF333 domain-containing protein [Methylobacterium gossipiicola]|uniref:Hemolysin n=1 Tax=Methylobacterium gossipiicola TaxID=582675 RepID=A0A1I2RNS7_9HYPH|nr:DUF333 domain-containing protein [Methylobacterium gossipiicola]SFG42314.1 hypothetical protein SAMN05192565_10345 [Methylobacterium gossipiicola]